MQSLNFSRDPWLRFLDFHQELLDYKIHLPAIPSDQFSSTTRKWLHENKLRAQNHSLSINKEAFKPHDEDL